MKKTYTELHPPQRLLLGAGPSNIDPRVLKALLSPIVGHLDPYFVEVMNETVELLRYAFRTRNHITFPISGTGTAAMESSICNLVEKGDEVIVCVNGFFGERMKEIVKRCGGQPVVVESKWGEIISKESVEMSLSQTNAKLVTIVHAETSTGILQPLEDISRIVHEYGGLLVVDGVTSLGGCNLEVDKLGIDVCFSASQKCLNCPPGLAPITANERAMETIRNRKTKVQSWYLDLSTIEEYWLEENRAYHHTAPILLVYALREALRLLYDEGLEPRWRRHIENSNALIEGLETLKLAVLAAKEHQCPALIAARVPRGISDIKIRKALQENHGITISGGLGVLSGYLWRIGLMGINSAEEKVILFLESIERELKKEGYSFRFGSSIAAAMKSFS